jgi:hypothetical protein
MKVKKRVEDAEGETWSEEWLFCLCEVKNDEKNIILPLSQKMFSVVLNNNNIKSEHLRSGTETQSAWPCRMVNAPKWPFTQHRCW